MQNAITPEATSPDPQAIALISGRRSEMAAHIQKAAETTGVSFDFLLAQANQESKLNPDAKNSRSSASGLFQFTAGTWLAMVHKHGAEHGLEKYASAITRGANGQYYVKDKDLRAEILDLRKDPALSSVMAGEYATDNAKYLQKKLGRPVTDGDLYMAHFLGAGGALKVLRNVGNTAPQTPPELHQAANANPEIFKDSAGDHKSMDDVYRSVSRRYKRAVADAAALSGKLRPEIDLAALRSPARPTPPEPIAETNVALAEDPLVITGEDLSKYGFFPVALPPRQINPSVTPSQSTPPSLGMPSLRADTGTMHQLLIASER